VDPGVGTSRRLIAVSTVDQWFVLPDNGLVGEVLRAHPPIGLWEIANPALRREPVSNTFHGRDVLAPAAAHLLLGRNPDELGPRLASYVPLPGLEPSRNDDGYSGEVIFIDAFGNLITNLDRTILDNHPLEDWTIDVAGSRIAGVVTTYGHQPPGTLVALVGSSGRLEVSIVNGNAARRLTVGVGTKVNILGHRDRTRP
ncbi:SAM hydrolase/SAM-dependent halogenase family protein, partial [Singulisphaera rosea]